MEVEIKALETVKASNWRYRGCVSGGVCCSANLLPVEPAEKRQALC